MMNMIDRETLSELLENTTFFERFKEAVDATAEGRYRKYSDAYIHFESYYQKGKTVVFVKLQSTNVILKHGIPMLLEYDSKFMTYLRKRGLNASILEVFRRKDRSPDGFLTDTEGPVFFGEEEIFINIPGDMTLLFFDALMDLLRKYLESKGFVIVSQTLNSIKAIYSPPSDENKTTTTKQQQIVDYLTQLLQNSDKVEVPIGEVMQKFDCSDSTILRALRVLSSKINIKYRRAWDKIIVEKKQ